MPEVARRSALLMYQERMDALQAGNFIGGTIHHVVQVVGPAKACAKRQAILLSLVNEGRNASPGCLIAAMAAIGLKTQLKEILTVGWKPVALMCAETLLLGALFYGLLMIKGGSA